MGAVGFLFFAPITIPATLLLLWRWQPWALTRTRTVRTKKPQYSYAPPKQKVPSAAASDPGHHNAFSAHQRTVELPASMADSLGGVRVSHHTTASNASLSPVLGAVAAPSFGGMVLPAPTPPLAVPLGPPAAPPSAGSWHWSAPSSDAGDDYYTGSPDAALFEAATRALAACKAAEVRSSLGATSSAASSA